MRCAASSRSGGWVAGGGVQADRATGAVLLIPLYRLMITIGWGNTLTSLVIPFIFSAYGTFLMRQFFVSIPRELEEAAVIDTLMLAFASDPATRWTWAWRTVSWTTLNRTTCSLGCCN